MLKEQKEAFVTGHSGTTIFEIFLICASSPIGISFYSCFLLLLFNSNVFNKQQQQQQQKTIRIVLEFLVILVPMILCQTKFLYPVGVTILLVEFATILFHYHRFHPQQQLTSTTTISSVYRSNQEIPSLTLYRSSIYFHTFIAILAVDFHLFPRTLAKTETVGYGFMDLGASSFVISSGLVSSFKNKSSSSTTTILLLVLGLLRIATNKSTDYQEHVSEYGTHWNFFFTLAVIRCTAMIKRTSTIIPWILLVCYQILLSVYHVQEYIENSSRIICPTPTGIAIINEVFCPFFAANREGILGCISYSCLHWASQTIGHYCLWSSPSSGSTQWKRLTICSIILWVLHFFCTIILNIPVSRRSTNLTFVTWSLAHNVTMLVVFCLVAAAFVPTPDKMPSILSAVNHHGFLMFVISNLLTGAVNLSINTLQIVHDSFALIILIGYVACIALIALVLERIKANTEKSNYSCKPT